MTINTTTGSEFAVRQTLDLLTDYTTNSRTMRELLRMSNLDDSLGPEVRGYIQSRALGVVRHLNTINFIAIRVLGKRNLSDLSVDDQSLLRLAIYDLRWSKAPLSNPILKRLGSSSLTATVSQAENFNLERRTKNLEYSSALGIKQSHPTFLVDTLSEHLGHQEAVELMQRNNGPRDYFLRVNKLMENHDEVIRQLRYLGVVLEEEKDFYSIFRVIQGIPSLFSSPEFMEGAAIIQDKGSVAVGQALAPLPGMKVWDACAAPGMKTHLLWELMNAEGNLIATDISANRLEKARQRWSSLGCDRVSFLRADAMTVPVSDADKILIDAPCTSTGILRSHPSFKWRLNKDTLMSIMSIQHKLLDGILSSYSDKPGTEIVYATCSLLPHEGESQIDSALGQHSIRLMEIPLQGSPGYPGFKCSSKVIRLFPHRHNSNGFFICRMAITE